MIYKKKPEGFDPLFSIGTCYVEHEGKFALLLRQDHKPQGNTWGLPGGKIDAGETPAECMAREVWEETGIEVSPEELTPGVVEYVRYPDFDFICHFFHLPVTERPEITLREQEHKDVVWVTTDEALALPLIPGFEIHLRGEQLP